MTPFTSITALAVPLPEDNVDTDIIVPARFLLITEKRGFGRYAFYDRRYDAAGEERPEFVLNDPGFNGAQILIAGANFGCGSSREHAPWALADLGFRAIVAPSFGEIFASNCVKNGMLPAILADTTALLADAAAGRSISIDLANRTIGRSNGGRTAFMIDDGSREMLLNGWGEIETIIDRHASAIANFEQLQRGAQPWLWTQG